MYVEAGTGDVNGIPAVRIGDAVPNADSRGTGTIDPPWSCTWFSLSESHYQ